MKRTVNVRAKLFTARGVCLIGSVVLIVQTAILSADASRTGAAVDKAPHDGNSTLESRCRRRL
jgi:hypothetical protein